MLRPTYGIASSLATVFAAGFFACSSPDASDGESPAPEPVAQNVVITLDEVALFQGTKSKLSDANGDAVHSDALSIVRGRAALLRAYIGVERGRNMRPRPMHAELRLTTGSGSEIVLTDDKSLAASSRDEQLGSTFNFDIDASKLMEAVRLVVTVTGATDEPLRFPREGAAEIAPIDTGREFSIHVIPVNLEVTGDPDASGADAGLPPANTSQDPDGGAGTMHYLPDLEADQIERIKTRMMQLLPIRNVHVEIGAPLDWRGTIEPSGRGWGELLAAIVERRSADNPRDDVFYVGMFKNGPRFGSYCRRGCVLGLAPAIVGRDEIEMRALLSVGWSGDVAADTVVHELGHTLGRPHSPCGNAAGTDPKYPYPGATLGAWGYDTVTRTLINPDSSRDFMSYCPPVWTSDYTSAAIVTRLRGIDLAPSGTRPQATAARLIQVDPGGSLAYGARIRARSDLSKGDVEAHCSSPRGQSTLVGRYVHFEDAPGGFVVLPEPDVACDAITLHGPAAIDGRSLGAWPLAR